jgi:hypothetical protein
VQRTSFERVRKLASDLPRVTVGTTYGTPALKVDGQVFAWIATHKSAEPNTLGVRVDYFERDHRIASEPDVFYLKPHYADYSCVLVRLARISDAALRDLLDSAWQFVNARKKRKTTRRHR